MIFTRDLSIGSVGEDVRQLQQFLNEYGFIIAVSGPGSPGHETINFGPLTQTALAKFQENKGIKPATGYFGPVTRTYMNVKSKPMTILETVKANLGKHLTLDASVPASVGCAEAVSTILRDIGINVPQKGIAGTNALLLWCQSHPEHFTALTEPEEGALLISATGTGNGNLSNGHTGFFGAFGVATPNDWGICSNNSDSGLFLELWTWSKWQNYYHQYGGMPNHIFRVRI